MPISPTSGRAATDGEEDRQQNGGELDMTRQRLRGGGEDEDREQERDDKPRPEL